MRPLSDRILVKPDDEPEVSDGGIHLAYQHERPKNRGVIVAVGQKVKHVKAGDHIQHERMEAYDPGKIELNGELHFIMREKNVLAIIENGK